MRRCLALNKSLKTADKCAFFISDFIKEQATGGFLGNKTFVWVYFRRWINPHLVHAVITISNMSVWSIITRPSAGEQVFSPGTMSRLSVMKAFLHQRTGSRGDMMQQIQQEPFTSWRVTTWRNVACRCEALWPREVLSQDNDGVKRSRRVKKTKNHSVKQSVCVWKPTIATLSKKKKKEKEKLLQCESGLVVSLGTERRLSISEPSAARERAALTN